jgi:AraC-like DNA-binding protein
VFTFIDLILFAGIIQGIFLMISLQFIAKKNKDANRILMLLIGISVIVFIREMLSYHLDPKIFWRTAILTESTIYLFAPLIYLYFKKLVFRNSPYGSSFLKHCILAIFMLLYFFWTLTLSNEQYVAIHGRMGIFYTFLIMEVVGVLSFAFYSYLSLKIVRKIKNTENPTLYTKQITRYIQFVLLGITLLWIFWGIGVFNVYYLGNAKSLVSYKFIWFCITTFLFIVGYFSFTQPEIVRLPIVKKAASKDRLSKAEIVVVKKKLQHLIDNEHIYMQSDLSLKNLAKALDTTANNLSWLLNSVYEKTFYEYINEYRIKAFLKKIEDGEHKKQTLLSIAMDSGFNSKSTFNKTFKSLMNDTPSRYIEKMYS